MQTLAPDSFCPLTDPQPYQRDRDKPRQGVVANTLRSFRQGAVGFIERLCEKFFMGRMIFLYPKPWPSGKLRFHELHPRERTRGIAPFARGAGGLHRAGEPGAF